jgi:dimeric dUTPase (all-alpha-NTP-PPase superfamily)
MVNYKELQAKQKELDEYIIKKKGIDISKEHLLSNTFLAAIDELCNEVEEDMKNPEEWIDVLHFVLSIGNQMGFEYEDVKIHVGYLERMFEIATDHLLQSLRLSKCFKHWSHKRPSVTQRFTIQSYLEIVLKMIYSACEQLNCDMVTEYNKKHKINVERQNNGY